mmetsp:Transcript_67227/g.93596  ORF Transcript_67227/g.93596 Transcript_67227/m.93596 type:complete len:86 (-) Transcript_67227:183-440(-)
MILKRATSTPLRDMYQRWDTNMPMATATTTPATTSGTEMAAVRAAGGGSGFGGGNVTETMCHIVAVEISFHAVTLTFTYPVTLKL